MRYKVGDIITYSKKKFIILREWEDYSQIYTCGILREGDTHRRFHFPKDQFKAYDGELTEDEKVLAVKMVLAGGA